MSTAAADLPLVRVDSESDRSTRSHAANRPDRERLMRRARRLSLLSIGWMTIEAGVAISAALIAGSVALLGFGFDSLIELASAATILWLYTNGRGSSEVAERRARRAVAVCFATLALYLAFDAIDALAGGARPRAEWLGVVVTVGALLCMPLLAGAKSRVAVQLASSATAGDAAQSWLCAVGTAAALLSILARNLLGWGWLDPVAALVIAAAAVYEGRQTWRGEACADCRPIGYGSAGGCDCC